MTEPLLTIRNTHAPACGDPPIVSNSNHRYIGYFENVFGEQWVFTYDRETKTATLQGGDINWNNPQVVCDGKVPGLQLQKDEAAWLLACWNAAVPR
jgi:hypothetical protein